MTVLYKCQQPTANLGGPWITLLPGKVLRYAYEVELDTEEMGMAAIVLKGVQWFEVHYEPASSAKTGPRALNRLIQLEETAILRSVRKSVVSYYGGRNDGPTLLIHVRFDPDNGPLIDAVCEGFAVDGDL